MVSKHIEHRACDFFFPRSASVSVKPVLRCQSHRTRAFSLNLWWGIVVWAQEELVIRRACRDLGLHERDAGIDPKPEKKGIDAAGIKVPWRTGHIYLSLYSFYFILFFPWAAVLENELTEAPDKEADRKENGRALERAMKELAGPLGGCLPSKNITTCPGWRRARKVQPLHFLRDHQEARRRTHMAARVGHGQAPGPLTQQTRPSGSLYPPPTCWSWHFATCCSRMTERCTEKCEILHHLRGSLYFGQTRGQTHVSMTQGRNPSELAGV